MVIDDVLDIVFSKFDFVNEVTSNTLDFQVQITNEDKPDDDSLNNNTEDISDDSLNFPIINCLCVSLFKK